MIYVYLQYCLDVNARKPHEENTSLYNYWHLKKCDWDAWEETTKDFSQIIQKEKIITDDLKKTFKEMCDKMHSFRQTSEKKNNNTTLRGKMLIL